jgi:hypothetical protein
VNVDRSCAVVGGTWTKSVIASYFAVVLGDPTIALSDYKHYLSQEDILRAYRNPIRVWDLGDGFTMMMGPNWAAIIQKVGYV